MDASSSTANRCHVQGYGPSMKFIRAGNLAKAKEPQHHHTDLVDKAVKSEIPWLEFQRNLNAIKRDEDRIMKKIRLLRLSGASGMTTAMEENNLCAENETGKQTDRELRENRVLADLHKLISSRRVVDVDETPSGSNLKGKVVPLKRQFGGKHELKRSKQQLAPIMEEEKQLIEKLTFENECTIAKVISNLGIIIGNDVHDLSLTHEKNAVIQSEEKLEENGSVDEFLKPATIRTDANRDLTKMSRRDRELKKLHCSINYNARGGESGKRSRRDTETTT